MYVDPRHLQGLSCRILSYFEVSIKCLLMLENTFQYYWKIGNWNISYFAIILKSILSTPRLTALLSIFIYLVYIFIYLI
jgi:hypothetical protein